LFRSTGYRELHAAAFAPAPPGRVRHLPRATVELSEPFTGIRSVRELADGRVFVVDGREAEVRLVDLARGTAILVGRQGAGPGEYKAPQHLLPLPGDSTLLTDTGLRRSIVLTPDGRAG
jgi:hypothetical protein